MDQTARHVSFLFEYRLEGAHIHVKVRSASRHLGAQVNHSRGLCGELVMSNEEWVMLRKALAAAPLPGPVWTRSTPAGRQFLCAPAGHPDLAEFETDHDEQHFVEFVDRTDYA
jgi:hypothetical protein